MRFFYFLAVGFFLFASVSNAGTMCYSSREAEAEQGIRIHSELMVIGLNCTHMTSTNGESLYAQHRKFTAKNASLLASYENILMDYMRKSGDSNPEASLNTLRTDFANKISNDAAKMRPDIFCKTYASRIEKASQMDQSTLRKWASMSFKSHPVSRPVCQ